jgi:hypothetical protein
MQPLVRTPPMPMMKMSQIIIMPNVSFLQPGILDIITLHMALV